MCADGASMAASHPAAEVIAAAPCPSSPSSARNGATRERAGSSTTWRTMADLVIRYGGGNNAGHTVVNPHGHFKLHLIPVGDLPPRHEEPARQRRGDQPAGAGRPSSTASALHGFDCENLFISDRAHLVMPYHVLLDQLEERERGRQEARDDIARDRSRRTWTRSRDAGSGSSTSWSPTRSARDWTAALPRISRIVGGYLGRRPEIDGSRLPRPPTPDDDRRRIPRRRGRGFGRHVVDGQAVVDEALERGDRILLEGQLGTMRDIDWGIYPYVTSSSPIPGGASLGAGLPAVRIDQVLGVAKAYTTAVGAGPLPTELDGAEGEELRERGAEYGTSTGRARRCGWYDAVAVRFSVRLGRLLEHRAHQARRPRRVSSASCVARAYRDPADGREWTTVPASTSVYRAAGAGLRGAPGMAGRYDRLPLMGRASRAARAPTSSASRGWRGVPISHVSVGPGTCPDDRSRSRETRMKLGVIVSAGVDGRVRRLGARARPGRARWPSRSRRIGSGSSRSGSSTTSTPCRGRPMRSRSSRSPRSAPSRH